MILTVLAVLVVVLAPAGIIWLTKKVKFLGLIGAVAVFGVYGPGYEASQFIYFQF